IQPNKSDNPTDKEKKKFTRWDDVFVDDISYIDHEYKAKSIEEQSTVDNVVQSYNLQHNAEQDQAFRVIANHVTSGFSNQLLMYLGGMGGTGKSQIIKALTHFFERRKESVKMLVCAPTGSAAALINGSTYHSVLGFGGTNEDSGIMKAKDNLAGV